MTDTEYTAVGDCPNCGYVVGEDVEMVFPRVANCNKCGGELDTAKVVESEEVEQVLQQ